MCGRFFLRPELDEILAFFSALPDEVDGITSPRLNVAPTQQVLAAYDTVLGQRALGWFRWGLVPSWWKDSKLPAWFNARSETVHDKPAFRAAFKHHRCLIPASGFYEWHTQGKTKTPYAIEPAQGDLWAMAGVWENWTRGPEPVRSAAILTADAHGPMAAIHDRVPVFIPPEHHAAWLDPKTDVETLHELLTAPSPALRITEVGTGVNNVRNSSGDWFGEA